MRAVFFERDDAEQVAAALLEAGFPARAERERYHGEDDDEDHPWAVVADAPEPLLMQLAVAHDGWLVDDEPGATAPPRAGPLPLPTEPRRSSGRD